MKKAIILLLFWAIAYDMSAQAQRRDTVVLSVYNNNQRFMLYPMPFGKDRPDIDFIAAMRQTAQRQLDGQNRLDLYEQRLRHQHQSL